LAPNLLFRGFFVLFFLTFIIALPVYFTNEGFLLYNSRSLSKSIEWKRDSNLTYPNLTVCFAKFFDKKLLKGKYYLDRKLGQSLTLNWLRNGKCLMDVHILRRLAKNVEVASPIISCSEILQW
jgi:hypothetical protein